MPRLAVYSATKHAVKGLTEALSIEFSRHGIRVADTLPGLIDTAILRMTPNRSDGNRGTDEETLLANAPKKGPFRLMPPRAVAEAVWAAYGSDKLHWYVPPEIQWIDRIVGFAPERIRKRIKSLTAGIVGER
jgi:NAD(P)-dependent dehydrogenase (short-subunit alcohol dehydrogenase family)